jgi:hypothetical protein
VDIDFRHADTLWIPGNDDSVVALFVNERKFVICQYREERDSLPIGFTFSSYYSDGVALTDNYHYASGIYAVAEMPSLYVKHLSDRVKRRPDTAVVSVSVEELVKKWESNL